MVQARTRLLLAILVFLTSFNPSNVYLINTSVTDCDWPMPGKDLINSRLASEECGFSPIKLTEKWKIKYKNDSYLGIVAWDGKVYQTCNGAVYCINANTGDVIWKYDSIYIGYLPIINDGKLYIDCFDNPYKSAKIICIDASNGTLIHKYDTGIKTLFWLANIYEDKAYFSDSKKLYCLDIRDWRQLWSYDSKAIKKPVISHSCLYYPWAVCLDATTGELVWKSKQTLGSSMVFEEGKIYTRYHKSKYYILCLDAASGETVWEEPLNEFDKYLFPFSTECASVYNNKFFFFNKKTALTKDTNSIYCFDLNAKKKPGVLIVAQTT